ncbi:MAG TPA: hypothetical protein VOB72_10140 [Candidatus Dormibacteraeota bacterium]|nr:hypothetical protein [Candidatus Dormibacteraeota bacterium]
MGVGDDHEQDRLLADGVPEDGPRPDQALDRLPAHLGDHLAPALVGLEGELFGAGQAGALLARPAALSGPPRRGLIEDGGVALDAGDDVGTGQLPPGQRRVGAVAAEQEAMIGQPAGYLLDHGLAEIEQGRPALAVQAHVDGQAEWLAAPGRADAEREHDQVQAVREHGVLSARADGVAEAAGAVDFASALVEEGVVEVQHQALAQLEMGEEQPQQPAPQPGRRPRSRPQEAVVGVEGVHPVRVADGDHPGHRAPAGAEHPGPDQDREERR